MSQQRQRSAHTGASTKSSNPSVGRNAESSTTPSQGIQVLRYSSDTSLTATVRVNASSPQVLWDRARAAFESGLRRSANRTELEALYAALLSVGIDVSGSRGVPQRNTAAAANGPSSSGSGRRTNAGLGAGGTGAARTVHPPLTRSRNAWTPSFLNVSAEAQSEDLDAIVASTRRRAKAILNKLVPEKFVTLAEQILGLPLHRHAVLEAVISEIFDKALAEPYFCGVYADLCEVLNRTLPNIAVDHRPGVSQTNFRKMLLARCQAEFVQRALTSESRASADRASDESETETWAKNRRRTLGNTIFVGELFKRHLLSEKIIHECVQMLLKEGENEDSIETLAKLLSVAGSSMDRLEARSYMDAYFAKIGEMANNPEIRARYRFMLKDCIELRKQKWKPRRTPERPTTLEEIHGKKTGRASRQSSQSLVRKAAQLRFTGADAEASKIDALDLPTQVPAAAPVTAAKTDAKKPPVATKSGATDDEAAGTCSQDTTKTESPDGADSSVPPLERTEQIRALIRGIVEDYMVNPCTEEVQRAIHDAGLWGHTELLGPVGMEELFYLACNARGSLRQPLIRAFVGAFDGLLSTERRVEGMVSVAHNLLDLEDELDMPMASNVLGECAATVITSGCSTTAEIGIHGRSVIEAAPASRRTRVMLSFLETLWTHALCENREQFAESLRAIQPILPSLPTAERAALESFLAQHDLVECLPELAIRERLRMFLEPGAENIPEAAEWLKTYLQSLRQSMNTRSSAMSDTEPSANDWYAFCRYTAEHLFFAYIIGDGVFDTMEIMRRLRQFIPLLQQVAGDDSEGDQWRQAQIAFAVQAACNRLDFPPDLMSGMFQVLYDADIITEEAFDRWREDVQDNTPGKTKALFHVNAFLNWLKEADEEPERTEPSGH
jgi:hypothetical protein